MNGESPLASAKTSRRANKTTMRLRGTIHHSFSCQIKLPSDRFDSLMNVLLTVDLTLLFAVCRSRGCRPADLGTFCGHHSINLCRDDFLCDLVRVRVPGCDPQALRFASGKCMLKIECRNSRLLADAANETMNIGE